MNPAFLVGVAIVIAGVAGLYFGLKRLLELREFDFSCADALAVEPGTHVKLKATVTSDEPLVSRLSERSCVYYRSRVVEQRRGENSWIDEFTVEQETRWAEGVRVEDETGTLGLEPGDCELRSTSSWSRVDDARLLSRYALPEPDLGHRYLFEEAHIPVERVIHVSGVIERRGRRRVLGGEVCIDPRAEGEPRRAGILWVCLAAGAVLAGIAVCAAGLVPIETEPASQSSPTRPLNLSDFRRGP